MTDTLSKFNPQITEIAAHAKAIGFDIENGDLKDLVRSYIQSTLSFYKDENRDSVYSAIKSVLK